MAWMPGAFAYAAPPNTLAVRPVTFGLSYAVAHRRT
jgi:hypothetical protein